MNYRRDQAVLNCPTTLAFSSTHSTKRLERAYRFLGETIVCRIIGIALFLLGANREQISEYLGIPTGTFLSLLTRFEKSGLSAFYDKRKSTVQITKINIPINVSLEVTDDSVGIRLDQEERLLMVPRDNLLQCKTVLLTFFHSGFLSCKDISSVLGLSERYIRELNVRLHREDVDSLTDRRQGQLVDYRFTTEIKAELIQQFAANAVSGKAASSRVLAEDLKQRCNLELSDRTIRQHMQELGLSRIKQSLPGLVEEVKKSSQK